MDLHKLKILKMNLQIKTVGPIPLTQTATSTITTTTTTQTVTEWRENQILFTHTVRHVEKQTILQRNATLEPMQLIDRLPGTEDRKDRIRCQREPIKVILMKLLKLQPKS